MRPAWALLLLTPLTAGCAGLPWSSEPGWSAPAAPPVYGAPAYGAPAYGPPAYGLPAYGPPAYGPPAYGPPAYGPPAYGPPAYGAPGSAPPPTPPPPPAATEPAARALAFARSKLGTPYCWGGTGPACFDCSGLTQAAWRAAGRAIPRTSELQGAQLPQIPMDRLQPGDIVWRPGHVGLYLGDGQVINATKPGDVVKIQPLKGYVKAVRPY